jgi:hypothetical protein
MAPYFSAVNFLLQRCCWFLQNKKLVIVKAFHPPVYYCIMLWDFHTNFWFVSVLCQSMSHVTVTGLSLNQCDTCASLQYKMTQRTKSPICGSLESFPDLSNIPEYSGVCVCVRRRCCAGAEVRRPLHATVRLPLLFSSSLSLQLIPIPHTTVFADGALPPACNFAPAVVVLMIPLPYCT